MASISDRDLQRVSGASGHALVRETPGTARCSTCDTIFSCGDHEDTWLAPSGETASRPPSCGPNPTFPELTPVPPVPDEEEPPAHRQALERDAMVLLRHVLSRVAEREDARSVVKRQLDATRYASVDFGRGGAPAIVEREYMEVLVAQIMEWLKDGRLDLVVRPPPREEG